MPARPHLWLGALVPLAEDAAPPPPESLPLGRAALALRGEGIGVVFGERIEAGCMDGWAARPGGWERLGSVPIAALHDRFPSQGRPGRFAAALAGAVGLPVGNPPALTLLCRDKLLCQRHLEAHGLALPEVEGDPARFAERLAAWERGFLKPRFGGLGRGVRRVLPGDPLPAEGEGAVPGRIEPLILQRAVPPPPGWAGCSLRVLVQRERGRWIVAARVLRRSREDPVVNVARGAEVVAVERVLDRARCEALDALALCAAEALASLPEGASAVELGVDAVLAADGGLHPIEVNGRPRGRLELLAGADPALLAEHVEACCRPFRHLAALAAG